MAADRTGRRERPPAKPLALGRRLDGGLGRLVDELRAELSADRNEIDANLGNARKASEGDCVTIDGTVSIVPAAGNVSKSCFVNVDGARAG